jgi:hypothetical protein
MYHALNSPLEQLTPCGSKVGLMAAVCSETLTVAAER